MITTKTAAFIAHVWNVRGTKLQEICSTGWLDTTENVPCSPNKVPLINDRLQPNIHGL